MTDKQINKTKQKIVFHKQKKVVDAIIIIFLYFLFISKKIYKNKKSNCKKN